MGRAHGLDQGIGYDYVGGVGEHDSGATWTASGREHRFNNGQEQDKAEKDKKVRLTPWLRAGHSSH